jgi:pimeloyl-ACP methyl ester carboxylesterase
MQGIGRGADRRQYRRAVSYPAGLFVIDRPAGSGYLEEEPSPDAPVVVLVHGTLDRANSFRRTMRRLEDVRVVAYDRRGYQDSRGPEGPVGIEGHIDDLLAVLHELGGRPVVVGHSLGAVVALGAAMAEPDKVAAIGAFEPPMRWLPLEERESRQGSFVQSRDPDVAVESFFRARVGDAAWDRLEPAARADRLADGPALLTELASLNGPPLFDVTKLPVPVIFGGGATSEPFHKENLAWLTEHVPGAERMEIPDAGHGAHLTHPDAFAGFVRRAMALAGLPKS